MNLFSENLPERVWNSLKTWAAIQSQFDVLPTVEQCAAQVRRIVASQTGSTRALPEGVVAFYADETLEMIRKLRAQPDADDGINDTNLEPVL